MSWAARSPALAITGPEVERKLTPSSRATIWASVVLPRPGRPDEQHVVERLAARLGGLDEHLEVLARRLLAREVAEHLRPQRRVDGRRRFSGVMRRRGWVGKRVRLVCGISERAMVQWHEKGQWPMAFDAFARHAERALSGGQVPKGIEEHEIVDRAVEADRIDRNSGVLELAGIGLALIAQRIVLGRMTRAGGSPVSSALLALERRT